MELIILNATISAVDAVHRCQISIKTLTSQVPLPQRLLEEELAVAGVTIRAKSILKVTGPRKPSGVFTTTLVH